MDARREIWKATVRLAIVMSAIGIVAAMTAAQVSARSEQAVVFGVIGVGFVASFIRSGRRSIPHAG